MIVMENVNGKFDQMMRSALSGIGTSHSFTARLMVRIEQEKEVARARRMQRIGIIAAVTAFALALISLVLLLTLFRVEETVSVGIVEGLKDKICLFFSDLVSGISLSTVINTVVVCLAVLAVFSWDAVLGKVYTKDK